MGVTIQSRELNESDDDPPLDPDSVMVGALLVGVKGGTRPSQVADVLDWDLVRVTSALNQLSRALIAAGQRLLEWSDGTIEIVPLYEAVQEDARQELLNSSNRDEGVSHEQLEALYKLLVSGSALSDFPSGRLNSALVELMELGLAVEANGQFKVPSFVRYSLRVLDGPTLPFGPSFTDHAPERSRPPVFSSVTPKHLTETTFASQSDDA